jgi:hypothetical protein
MTVSLGSEEISEKGLALCLFTGAGGAAINVGFALGCGLIALAGLRGPQASSFAVWAVNWLYCLYLLKKNHTVSMYADGVDVCYSERKTSIFNNCHGLSLSEWMGCGLDAASMGPYGTVLSPAT